MTPLSYHSSNLSLIALETMGLLVQKLFSVKLKNDVTTQLSQSTERPHKSSEGIVLLKAEPPKKSLKNHNVLHVKSGKALKQLFEH